MKLSEAPIGADVMTVERMGDEVRETHYRRVEGAVRYPNNVAVERLRLFQGVPGQPPRYTTKPVCFRSEAGGQIDVVPWRPWPINPSTE